MKLFDLKFRSEKDGLSFILTKVNTLLSIKQSHTFSKSSFNCFSISLTFLLWKTKHVSSTYKNRLHLTAIDISLTYIMNKKEPRIDPCGTPHDMLETSEKEFSKFTVNLRFDR